MQVIEMVLDFETCRRIYKVRIHILICAVGPTLSVNSLYDHKELNSLISNVKYMYSYSKKNIPVLIDYIFQ